MIWALAVLIFAYLLIGLVFCGIGVGEYFQNYMDGFQPDNTSVWKIILQGFFGIFLGWGFGIGWAISVVLFRKIIGR